MTRASTKTAQTRLKPLQWLRLTSKRPTFCDFKEQLQGHSCKGSRTASKPAKVLTSVHRDGINRRSGWLGRKALWDIRFQPAFQDRCQGIFGNRFGDIVVHSSRHASHLV